MSLFNEIIKTKKMLDDWRSTVVPFYEYNCDGQNFRDYLRIELMSHYTIMGKCY